MPPLPDLIGPVAALALALGILWLFYTGRILPRNTVPREDFERLAEVNASYADKFAQMIEAVKALTATVERMNGSKR